MIVEDESIEMTYGIARAIPLKFKDTMRHLNCPDVPIVETSSGNRFALYGVMVDENDQETDVVVICKPRMFGYSDWFHFVPIDKIESVTPSK